MKEFLLISELDNYYFEKALGIYSNNGGNVIKKSGTKLYLILKRSLLTSTKENLTTHDVLLIRVLTLMSLNMLGEYYCQIVFDLLLNINENPNLYTTAIFK